MIKKAFYLMYMFIAGLIGLCIIIPFYMMIRTLFHKRPPVTIVKNGRRMTFVNLPYHELEENKWVPYPSAVHSPVIASLLLPHEFLRIRDEWDAIVNGNPFLMSDYILSWFAAAHTDLHILTFRYDGVLVGGIPLTVKDWCFFYNRKERAWD